MWFHSHSCVWYINHHNCPPYIIIAIKIPIVFNNWIIFCVTTIHIKAAYFSRISSEFLKIPPPTNHNCIIISVAHKPAYIYFIFILCLKQNKKYGNLKNLTQVLRFFEDKENFAQHIPLSSDYNLSLCIVFLLFKFKIINEQFFHQ